MIVLRAASGILGLALVVWGIGLFVKDRGDVTAGAYDGLATVLVVGGALFVAVAVLRRPR